MSLLEVEDLSASYNGSKVLNAVSFCLDAGQVIAVVGRNGAGKSTLLKAIAGLLTSTWGSVRLNGKELAGLCRRSRAKRGIGAMMQGGMVFPHLTIEENVLIACHICGTDVPKQRIDQPLLRRRKAPAGSLSGGERQRLALAMALAPEPSVLLLDEPLANLDASARELVASEILRLQRAANVGIILVEQDIGTALRVSSHVLVLCEGTVAWTGSAAPESLGQILAAAGALADAAR